MSYVFRSSGYIRDRSVYCRCIASCRLCVDTRRTCASTSTLSASTYLAIHRISFAILQNDQPEFRRDVLHERWLSLGNSINLTTLYRECLEKDDTREGGFMWKALKIKILEWGILIFENMFFERRGVKNVFAFFFGKCLSRWPCRVECVKVFVFKIMEFVIEFLFFWILFFSKNINWNSSYFVSLKKICTKLKWQFS